MELSFTIAAARRTIGSAKARFVLMPGQSHGASFTACGGQISLAFIADPSAPLPLGESLMIAWPQSVVLVASYVVFQRQEVRA